MLALGGRAADIPFDHARGYLRILEAGDEGGAGPAGGAKEAGA